MKYIKKFEAEREPKFKNGDWVVANNISSWYEGIWDNLLNFLRTTPGQIQTYFDIGGISYNVIYFNTSIEEEFNSAYYNNNSIPYFEIDRDYYKIYDIGEKALRLATIEEIEKEKDRISFEISKEKYNL